MVLGMACSSDSDSDSSATSTPGSSNAAPTATAAPARSTASGTITLYSGRNEALVGPLIAQFEKDTGIKVEVRYAGSAALATTISEEGNASPADVFWSQDPGPVGALSDKLAPLPEDLLALVEDRYKSPEDRWVGVSGRVRVIVYNPDRVQPSSLPNSIKGLTAPEWKDRVGWAPTNASLQIMVTALRELEGDDVARQWLTDMKDNGAKTFGNNNAVLQAVAAGEVDVGIINHYYLHAARRTTADIKAENYYITDSNDAGALIMVSAAGILQTSDNKAAAERFIEYLLSPAAQQYFVSQTSEYAVIDGIVTPAGLKNLDDLDGPDIDLADLSDVAGTLQMLRDAGLVQ